MSSKVKTREAEFEEKRIKFLEGIQHKAREFANDEQSIPVQANHMMAAIVDRMASAYAFDLRVSDTINSMKDTILNLQADIEALRRVISDDSDTIDEENDDDGDEGNGPRDGLKLVH